jgi:DNA-binding response OmpR family regulator
MNGAVRSDLHREIARLRERNEALEREIEWLRELFMPRHQFPAAWRLTPAESRLLSALYASRGFITKEAAHHASASADEAETDLKLVDVHVHKLRRKLSPLMGNPVETVWGRGLGLARGARDAIAAALASEAASALRIAS